MIGKPEELSLTKNVINQKNKVIRELTKKIIKLEDKLEK
jgi:hypothetical protein